MATYDDVGSRPGLPGSSFLKYRTPTSISGVPQPTSDPEKPSGGGGGGGTYSTPIPGVALYGQAALAAKTAYANALARINQRRSSLLRSSGFAGDIDSETGVVRNMRVDGSSKYGTFQMLNRDQAGRADQARWLGIERGLGAGGGLAAQMRNAARFDFGREDADFAQQLTESLAGLQDEQASAAYSRDRALYLAELEAARMSIQGGDFNPADFSGLDSGDSRNDVAEAPLKVNYAGANTQAQKAAQAALSAAKKKKLSPAEAALAARSAALNSMYKLGR